MIRNILVCLLTLGLVSAARAVPALKPGAITEYRVELSRELRELAGNGRQLSPATYALVAVALPENFDPAKDWPVMVISATSDPKFNSSLKLLGFYAETAMAAGWILLAADPEGKVAQDDDGVFLRFALNSAALAGLSLQWPGAQQAPLAFGGFSGGAKHSGWLAAMFTLQGRRPIGVFQAGINQETVAKAGQEFKALDGNYRKIPVFLLGGRQDQIAAPGEIRDVETELCRAGFKQVQLEFFDGPHAINPAPLRRALDWFRELAGREK